MADFAKLYDTSRKISGTFHSVPLEWAKSTNNHGKVTMFLRLNLGDKTQALMSIKMYGLVGSLTLMAIQTLFSRNIGEISGDMLFSSLSMTLLLTGTAYFIFVREKAPEAAALFNGLIQFDLQFGKVAKLFDTQISREMLSLCFSYIVAMSSDVVAIGLSFGLHWQNPKSSLVGYWLIWETLDGEYTVMGRVKTLASKIGVCSFNYWIWCIGIEPAHFAYGAIHNLSATILSDNLKLFEKCCDQRKYSTYKLGEIFRHHQVLLGMYNDVQRGPLMLLLITATVSVLAFSVSNVVKLTTNDAFMVAMFLYLSCVCLVVTSFLIGGMSLVYKYSRVLLKRKKYNGKDNLSRKESKWENKFYKSCSPCKIMISSNSFVDQLTPLNMLSFSMDLTVNLLLVQ